MLWYNEGNPPVEVIACARYPILGQSDRVELLGSEGTMIIDDDHRDHQLYSEKCLGHAYVPGHNINFAYTCSNPSGDWALGDYWGPLGNETRSWLDHLVTGNPTPRPPKRAWYWKPPSAPMCACRNWPACRRFQTLFPALNSRHGWVALCPRTRPSPSLTRLMHR